VKFSREASNKVNILAIQQGYKASSEAIYWAMLRPLCSDACLLSASLNQ